MYLYVVDNHTGNEIIKKYICVLRWEIQIQLLPILPILQNGSMSIAFRFFDCVDPVVCVHYYHCVCLINVSNKSHWIGFMLLNFCHSPSFFLHYFKKYNFNCAFTYNSDLFFPFFFCFNLCDFGSRYCCICYFYLIRLSETWKISLRTFSYASAWFLFVCFVLNIQRLLCHFCHININLVLHFGTTWKIIFFFFHKVKKKIKIYNINWKTMIL